MNTNSPKTNRKIWLAAVIGCALLTLFTKPQTVSAQQWTGPDGNNNISNANTGNVGVGLTTPLYKFDVLSGTSLIARFGSTAAAHSQLLINAPSGYNSNLTLQNGGVSKWFLGNRAANDRFSLFESTGNIEVFSILQNGNVGIGTSTPSSSLDVVKNQNANTFVRIANNDSGAAGKAYFLADNGTSTFRMQQNGTGFGGAGATLAGEGVLYNTSPALTLMIDNAAGIIKFATGGTGEKMRLDATGNVGIGQSSPTQKLDVNGYIRSNGLMFPNGSLQTTAALISEVSGGSGLTGSGTSGSVTLNIGAGTGISVAADSVSVNYGATATSAVRGDTQITVSPGTGISGGGQLTLGSGGTVTLTNADKGSSQNIFKSIANAAGATQFSAASNNDAIRFTGSGGTAVTFDVATKTVVIDGSTSTPPAANISAGQFGQNTGGGNYTFPGNVTVNGNIAAKYQDVAEWVPSAHALPAGTVVTLDPTKFNHVEASSKAYDTRVAGVISKQPGITLGERGDNKVLVATTGRVRLKVDASSGPIQVGDLLVTSNIPGLAMKSKAIDVGGVEIHRPGTLIGKALEPLAKGRGEILILLSLQ